MKICALVAVTLVAISIHYIDAATPATIEFLFNMNDQPGDGYQLVKEIEKFPAFARNAVKVCVNGMWALYNNENYGLDSLTNTTSIAARGKGECTTTPVEEIVRTIRSIRPLIANLEITTGCVLWPNKNFLGDSIPALGTDPGGCSPASPYPSSAAFPAGASAAQIIKITGSSGTCACVDPKKGPFYIADASLFPTPEKALKTIMAYGNCAQPEPTCTTVIQQTRNVIFPYFSTE